MVRARRWHQPIAQSYDDGAVTLRRHSSRHRLESAQLMNALPSKHAANAQFTLYCKSKRDPTWGAPVQVASASTHAGRTMPVAPGNGRSRVCVGTPSACCCRAWHATCYGLLCIGRCASRRGTGTGGCCLLALQGQYKALTHSSAIATAPSIEFVSDKQQPSNSPWM